MVFPTRVVGTFVVHFIYSFSVFLRRDSGTAVRKDLGQDIPMLIQLPYGLNFADLFCTVS